jgi:hypothetical protein
MQVVPRAPPNGKLAREHDMNATRDRVFGLPRSRVLLGVLLALALMLSALGPAALVGVAAAPAEPVARLQVVVKEITVHKDHDPLFAGSGEMSLAVQVWRCNDGAPPPCSSQADPDKGHPGMLVDVADVLFSAETGDTVALGLVVPRDRAFPVFPGEPDVVRISLREWDGITSDPDEMGHVYHYLDTEERGLGLGTHTARSFKEEQYQWGDFTVTYEIRRAPLPDLRPVNIKVHDLPGSARNRVCMAVQNVELGEAGPHEVALQVDGVVSPGGRTHTSCASRSRCRRPASTRWRR